MKSGYNNKCALPKTKLEVAKFEATHNRIKQSNATVEDADTEPR